MTLWLIPIVGLGSIVGYELFKSWLESSTQTETTEQTVSPVMVILLILLAVLLLRR